MTRPVLHQVANAIRQKAAQHAPQAPSALFDPAKHFEIVETAHASPDEVAEAVVNRLVDLGTAIAAKEDGGLN